MAKHTGRPLEQIERDVDRDRFMSAAEAVQYGLIDQVVASRAEAEARRRWRRPSKRRFHGRDACEIIHERPGGFLR